MEAAARQTRRETAAARVMVVWMAGAVIWVGMRVPRCGGSEVIVTPDAWGSFFPDGADRSPRYPKEGGVGGRRLGAVCSPNLIRMSGAALLPPQPGGGSGIGIYLGCTDRVRAATHACGPRAASEGTDMAIRIKARSGETVDQMLRRFKKLCEKEGLTKDIKRKEFYEKPSERNRRAARKS
ncbi:MAG: 30S ribosomal protein S21, partial [Actinomycetes bacterium]